MDDSGRVGFAHRRLAIIDLSDAGAQPMLDRDGWLCVTFNGEIYNYKELRAELMASGEVFRSHSDTEVLLVLYRRYGEQMVDRLRGMFAFAIWDARRKGVFLARDPYGIKPLYYASNGRMLRFASQVSALLAGGGVSRELDPAGVVGFMMWGSVPEPVTIRQDISLLGAGHTLWVDESGLQASKRYWSLAATISNATSLALELSPEQAVEQACCALRDTVKAHMTADVPVGAFLSAGLDSSSITGMARRLTGHPLETLTLSFPEFEGTANDEAPLAAAIARHLDVANRLTLVDMQDFESEFPRFLQAMDQPTLDGINTWFISKAAAEAGFKVILSGLGGDELLGGYASFLRIPQGVSRAGRWRSLPGLGDSVRWINRYLTGKPINEAGAFALNRSYFGAYRLDRGVMMPWDLPVVLDQDMVRTGLQRLLDLGIESDEGEGESMNGFGRVAFLEGSRYMRNQLLRDSDWIGMAHSLEIRVPLVDRQLTEKTVGLAAAGHLGTAKRILVDCLPGGLPKEVMQRPKTGFTVPIWKWLRKSSVLDGWKQYKALASPRYHDYTRFGVSLLARMPEATHYLRQR